MSAKQLRKEVKRKARHKARRAEYNRRKNARGKDRKFYQMKGNPVRAAKAMTPAIIASWLRGAA